MFIADEARANESAVLVHCLAGVSRSVTVTLAYLMHARSLCLEDAFSLVRLRKPDISPNFHFLRQLHSFERQLLDLNPNRTPLSAQSTDSSYLTPDCVKCPRTGRCDCAFTAKTPSSSHSSSPLNQHQDQLRLAQFLHNHLRQTQQIAPNDLGGSKVIFIIIIRCNICRPQPKISPAAFKFCSEAPSYYIGNVSKQQSLFIY